MKEEEEGVLEKHAAALSMCRGGGVADWLLQRSRWKRSAVDLCQDDGLGNNSGCRPAGLLAEALGPNTRCSGPAGTSLVLQAPHWTTTS